MGSAASLGGVLAAVMLGAAMAVHAGVSWAFALFGL